MPTSDPTAILLAHNRWATHRILSACADLTHDQFHQRFDMGLGSLHDTLTHILAALRGWGDLLAERDQRERLDEDGKHRPTAELIELLNSISDDVEASVGSHPHDELVSGERGGRTFTFARGAVVTHVTTHGMHHRAQCVNMLRHLGVDPLPPSSVLEWTFMADHD